MRTLEKIEVLDIKQGIKDILRQKGIYEIQQMTELTKRELIKLGLNQNEIKQIEIKLQLKGLDLKR